MQMEAVRARHMFSKLTLFYADDTSGDSSDSSSEREATRGPLCLVRGEGQYIYDDRGKRYLDCVNNVAHVGHSHPALRAAAARQLAEINTNTRCVRRGWGAWRCCTSLPICMQGLVHRLGSVIYLAFYLYTFKWTHAFT